MPFAEFPKGSEFTCIGPRWVDRLPELDLFDQVGHRRHLTLLGARLRVHVDATRMCTGSGALRGASVAPQPCPQRRPAINGTQCHDCATTDIFRFAHQAHKGGYLPGPLRQYLEQPHWLYIATFADGTTKVGTAADNRKQGRLDEQGAVRGTYLLQTADGFRVRELEDAISDALNMTQLVRRSRKAAALANPLPGPALDQLHGDQSTRAAAALAELGVRSTPEEWRPPEEHGKFFAELTNECVLYPHDLSKGGHYLSVVSMIGTCALATLNEGEQRVVVDLGALKGHRLSPAPVHSPPVGGQPSLF